MQGLAFEAQRTPTPVKQVRHQGVSQVSSMDAYLVRAATVQHAPQSTHAPAHGQRLEVGAGWPPACYNRHANPRHRVPADRCIYRLGAHPLAMRDGQVLAVYLTSGDVPDKCVVGLHGTRHHHEPRGILVQPVDNPRAGQRRALRITVQQPVQERAGPVARARVHDEPSSLVDDQHMQILVDGVERNRLRLESARLLGRDQVDRHRLACTQAARGRLHGNPAHPDMPLVHELLQVAARELGGQLCQHLVDPLTVPVLPNGALPCLRGSLDQTVVRLEACLIRAARSRLPIIFAMRQSRPGPGGPSRVKRAPAGRLPAALLWLVVLALSAGCSMLPGKQAEPAPEDLGKLYAEAKADLDSAAWDRAIKSLERIDARASGTLLGQQALLDLAYAQWKSTERTTALATVDRFIKLHPSSPAFDYALYLRGMINFNDATGWLGRLSGQSISERDQRASRDAWQAFNQLVTQFPASRYAQDARLRMDYIVNALAEHEVSVARYYLRRGAYLAAANRARQAVTEFDRAPAAEEGLAIMAESYDRLGLNELRDAAQRVLRTNFPESRFLASASDAGVRRPWWRPW